MSVFDSAPSDEIRDRRLPWWVVPPEEVGTFLEIRRLVAKTPDSAVVLIDAVAYSCGFMLGAEILRRPGDVIEELGDVFDVRSGRVEEAKLLTMSIEYSDGRRGANTDFSRLEDVAKSLDAPTDGEVRVSELGGGGNGVQRHIEWWVTPLPPPGALTLVIGWWALGTEPVRTELDADAIIAASLRSQPIWPQED